MGEQRASNDNNNNNNKHTCEKRKKKSSKETFVFELELARDADDDAALELGVYTH